ncbi:hypothetical protein F5148DRAFT_1283051 [Russula earlei]|uniref:Uncharacterized protein n=1 Tax=Russula earlei TaxID=71964 RepID=A0ACC0UE38_9AGAM|nr:hypothetical protein F5148DRAFT_1283051 [Russula earlei]
MSWSATSPSACSTDADPIHFHFAHIRSLHGENPPELEKAIDDILYHAVTYFGYIARDIYNFHHVRNRNMAPLDETPDEREAMLRVVVQCDKLSMNQSSRVIDYLGSKGDNAQFQKPSATNFPFPLTDAFIITDDDNPITMHLWVLQTTTSKKHRGSPKGYDNICQIIDTLYSQLEHSNADRQATDTQASSCSPDSSSN